MRHQCLSSVSSFGLPSYQTMHEYFTPDTSSSDAWSNYADFNSYESSPQPVTLLNGDTVSSDSKMTHFIDNEFN